MKTITLIRIYLILAIINQMFDFFAKNHYSRLYDELYKPVSGELTYESVERVLSNFIHLQDLINMSMRDVGEMLAEAVRLKIGATTNYLQTSSKVKQVHNDKLKEPKLNKQPNPTNATASYLGTLSKFDQAEKINLTTWKSPRAEDLKKKKCVFVAPKTSCGQISLEAYFNFDKKVSNKTVQNAQVGGPNQNKEKAQAESQHILFSSPTVNQLERSKKVLQTKRANNTDDSSQSILNIANGGIGKVRQKTKLELIDDLSSISSGSNKLSNQNVKVAAPQAKQQIDKSFVPRESNEGSKDGNKERFNNKVELSVKRQKPIAKSKAQNSQDSRVCEKNDCRGEKSFGNTYLTREVVRGKKLRQQQNGYACHICKKVI